MDFAPSTKVREFQDKLTAFMEEYVYAAEAVAQEQITVSGDPHHHAQIIQELKQRTRTFGKFEPAQPLPLHTTRMTADHIAHVEFRELIVGEIVCLIA